MFQDEELARTDMRGRKTHDIIGRLAAQTLSPTTAQILQVVTAALGEYQQIEARAHRQNIAAAVSVYFTHLLPPEGWRFAGAEVHLGSRRVDLVWIGPDGAVLLDELKTGNARQLETTGTHEQVAAYLDCARSVWGDRLCGLRLLSTSEPSRSLFIATDGSATPIRATAHVRTAA